MKGNINKRPWKLAFSIFLLGLSGFLYYIHYLVFKDARHIFIYLLGDIAFVPISVLLVTLILEHILESKQKELMLHKLNMVLGAFFSEVGSPMLKQFEVFRADNPDLSDRLQIKTEWTPKDFISARNSVKDFRYAIDPRKANLGSLRDLLIQKRQFLLALLENPNLLEHDKITDMLWAIFHLTEELTARKELHRLSNHDAEHLSGDLKRCYGQLVTEWIDYMGHLKMDYPYLYSLAVRMNPFDPKAQAELT